MTNQNEAATLSTPLGVAGRGIRGEVLQRVSLALVILLCIGACALMFILDPFSLDVGSVYQAF
jgi:hypothetical protein